MNNQIKIDDDFKKLIPPLSSEEFNQLKENILNDGCRDPLVLWNEILIDGHNRYKICTENNIEFKTITKEFKDKQEVIEWIILNQFGRRNLSAYQRSELALKLKPLIQAKAKERQGTRNDLNITQKSAECNNSKNNETRDELAKIAGVSHDTIAKVSFIQEKGSEEQVKRARAGGKGNSINAIVKEIKDYSNETKVCSCCGKRKSIYDFYKKGNQCIQCQNEKTQLRRANSNTITDFRGNTKEVSPEAERLVNKKAAEFVKNLYDTERVVEYTVDDLIDDVETYFEYFTDGVKRSFEDKPDIVNKNKEKIKAVLDEAETAINTLKEMYLHE